MNFQPQGNIVSLNGYLTVSANNTSGSATHGYGSTPSANKIYITPHTDLGGRNYWISYTGSTTFSISISSQDLSDHIFGWIYIKN